MYTIAHVSSAGVHRCTDRAGAIGRGLVGRIAITKDGRTLAVKTDGRVVGEGDVAACARLLGAPVHA